jgi:purine-binding chemotaxis protein CheW
MRGVMNLRGSIIPVLDLNIWFGRPEVEIQDRIAIIVVESGEGEEALRLGIMVENVSEIVEISAANVESVPGMMAHAEFILAMAKINSEAKVLLDVQRILQTACAA